VEEKSGVRWHEQPEWYRGGVLLKKNKYLKEALNEFTGERVLATRGRIVTANSLLHSQTPDNIDALTSEHVEDHLLTPLSIVVEEDYDFGALVNPVPGKSHYLHS
jgi:hypothetical protein